LALTISARVGLFMVGMLSPVRPPRQSRRSLDPQPQQPAADIQNPVVDWQFS
jgi:hypothetical protein